MARILPLYIIAGFIAVALAVLIALILTQDAVAQESQPSPLHCVDSNANGVIDISELFDVIDAYFDGTRITHPTPTPTPTQTPEPSPTPTLTPALTPTHTPTHTPTPTQTPTPTPTHGSRDNPVPLGTAFEVRNSETDHWEVTVLETTPDATELVLDENDENPFSFNDPPEAGNQFFIAKVRAKYLGTDSNRFNGSRRLGTSGDGGVVYTILGNSCGDIPDELPNPELFTNGTIEGNKCWEIASTDAESLLMIFEDASASFLPSEGNRVWFSMDE